MKRKTLEERQLEELDEAIKQNEIIYDSILSLCDLAHNIADSLHLETDDERIQLRLRRVQDDLYNAEERNRIEADRLRNAPITAECFRDVIDLDEAASPDLTPIRRTDVEDQRAALFHDLLQELTDTIVCAYSVLRPVKEQIRDGASVLDMTRRAYLYQHFVDKLYFNNWIL